MLSFFGKWITALALLFGGLISSCSRTSGWQIAHQPLPLPAQEIPATEEPVAQTVSGPLACSTSANVRVVPVCKKQTPSSETVCCIHVAGYRISLYCKRNGYSAWITASQSTRFAPHALPVYVVPGYSMEQFLSETPEVRSKKIYLIGGSAKEPAALHRAFPSGSYVQIGGYVARDLILPLTLDRAFAAGSVPTLIPLLPLPPLFPVVAPPVRYSVELLQVVASYSQNHVPFHSSYADDSSDPYYGPFSLAMKRKPSKPGAVSSTASTVSAVSPEVSLRHTASDRLLPTYISREGHRVAFSQESGRWYATIDERAPEGLRRMLHHIRVCGAPGYSVETLSTYDAATAQRLLRVTLPRFNQPGLVYIGPWGILGGGKPEQLPEKSEVLSLAQSVEERATNVLPDIDQPPSTLYAIVAEGLTEKKKDNEIIKNIQKVLNEAPNKDAMLNFQEATTGDTALHLSIKNGNSALIDFLLSQKGNYLARFLAENAAGDNAWLLAAAHGKVRILQKLWDWSQKVLNEQSRKDRLLLVKGSNGQSAWHKAAESGQVAVLDKLWAWAQTGLTPTQRREQLFAKDAIWGSIWHLAALNGEVDVLEKIWGWCAELTPHAPQACQQQLLFDSNSDGNSAWHYAAWAEKIAVLDKLWSFAQASLTEEQRIQELLLKNKNDGNSAWHWAAESGKVQSLNKLWEIAQATLTPQQCKEAFFFAKNHQGDTACHLAKNNLQTAALNTLWQVGQVLWQRAAEQGNLSDLEQLWAFSEEFEPMVPWVKRQLFFSKNNQGLSAWLLALMHKRATMLHKLREWGRELLITPTAPERVKMSQIVNLLTPNPTAVDAEGIDQAVFPIFRLKKQNSLEDTQSFIQQVGESIHRRIETMFKQIADELFDQYQQRLRSLETVALAQVFTEGIVTMSNLQALSSMNQFIEQVDSIQRTLSGLSTPIEERLCDLFHQLENLFFLQILTPENFQATYASWSHPFKAIADYFAEEQQAVKGRYRDIQCLDPSPRASGTLVIRGTYIKFSKIITDTKKLSVTCSNKPTKVNIFAANTVVVDRDLEAIGDQLQLTIIAPKWDIVGNRSIILDGAPGAAHESAQAHNGDSPGASGADGHPGLPGGPAGSFFGIGSHFIHSSQLTITANGGHGGPGQAGGDGAEGNQGEDARIGGAGSFLVDSDDYFRYYGNPGGVGGNGGKGGIGGLGGLAGQIKIFRLNGMDPPSLAMSTVRGSVGVDGIGGEGGIGGWGGRDRLEKSCTLHIFLPKKGACPSWLIDSSYSKTRAASGSKGIDGGYITGRKSPEPAVVIENPAYIVNDYKGYLNELIGQTTNLKKYALPQSISRLLAVSFNVYTLSLQRRKIEPSNTTHSPLKTKYKQYFINQLNTHVAIHGLYDTLGFVDELRGIEKQFYQLSQAQLDTAYQSLLTRISAYAANPKEHETSKEYKKVLNYLYTATLSRSLVINSASERQFIIDIDGYLDLLKENIDKFRTFTQAVNQAQLRQNYNSGLDNSIREAERFIKEEIISPIDKVCRRIDEKIVALVDEVTTLQKQAETEKAQLMQKKQALEETCTLHVMFGIVKKLGQTLGYLGSVAPVVRFVAYGIDAVPTVAKSLLLDESTALEQKEPLALPAGVANNVSLSVNPFRVKDKQNMTQFTQPMARGVDIYSKFRTDQTDGDVISAQIQQIEEKIDSLKRYEENIDKILKPMLDDIEENLKSTASGLALKSQVALDVTQWKVQSHLRDVKLQLVQFTQGFKVEHEMARFIEKLEESMTTLIHLYDRIQSYQAQQNLANYIADIHSPAAHLITINDRTLNDAVNELEQMIQSNVLLAQCQMAIDALKQWVFPFAEHYLQSMLGSSESEIHLKTPSSSTQISVDQAVAAIEKVRAKIKEYTMSIVRQDQYLHEGLFSSRYYATEPFFVWENQPYQDTIARLLAGQKVLLKAGILGSPADKQAIKFSRLEVNLKASNQTLQAEIDSKLKGFKVRATHLGHSYYRYHNRFYVITSDPQTLEFLFEKENRSGEPLHKNKVYDKLAKGNLVLSPYAMWEIQLLNATKRADYTQLTVYKDEVDLELGGYASYVTGAADDWNVDDYYTADDTLAIKAQALSRVRTRVKRAATKRYHRSQTTLRNNTMPTNRPSRPIEATGNRPPVVVSSGATSLNSWVTTLKNFCRDILSNYWDYQPVSDPKILNINGVHFSRSTAYPKEPSAPLLGLTASHTSNGDAQKVTDPLLFDENLVLGQCVMGMLMGPNKTLNHSGYLSPAQQQKHYINRLAQEVFPAFHRVFYLEEEDVSLVQIQENTA